VVVRGKGLFGNGGARFVIFNNVVDVRLSSLQVPVLSALELVVLTLSLSPLYIHYGLSISSPT